MQLRVCLTGGVGFIGRATANALVQRGHDVVALDTLSPQVHADPESAAGRFPGPVVIGDVRDPGSVARAIEGCQAVVHLAAETGVAQSMYERDRYLSVNVGGTDVVAEIASSSGCGLVLLSSRAVYGEGAYRCIEHGRVTGGRCCSMAEPDASREGDRLAPVSVYGESKVGAERVAATRCAGKSRLIVVRPQNVVGAGQAPHNPYTGVLAAFAVRLAAGLPPQVYGSGSQTRDFVDVADVARALVAMAEGVAGDDQVVSGTAPELTPVVNLGSGLRTSLVELAELTIAARGCSDLQPMHVDVTRPGDIDHACADLAQLSGMGAPLPTVALSESVRAFLDYAASQGSVDPRRWDVALEESRRHDGGS